MVHFNKYAITPGKMYRSAQPSPKHIAKLKAEGIKTIINLRGARDCGVYELEEAACREHGIALENFPVSSRDMPKVEWVNGAKELTLNAFAGDNLGTYRLPKTCT